MLRLLSVCMCVKSWPAFTYRLEFLSAAGGAEYWHGAFLCVCVCVLFFFLRIRVCWSTTMPSDTLKCSRANAQRWEAGVLLCSWVSDTEQNVGTSGSACASICHVWILQINHKWGEKDAKKFTDRFFFCLFLIKFNRTFQTDCSTVRCMWEPNCGVHPILETKKPKQGGATWLIRLLLIKNMLETTWFKLGVIVFICTQLALFFLPPAAFQTHKLFSLQHFGCSKRTLYYLFQFRCFWQDDRMLTTSLTFR